MNKLLSYLEEWKISKTKIFESEGYKATITKVLGDSKKARYIDLDTEKLVNFNSKVFPNINVLDEPIIRVSIN